MSKALVPVDVWPHPISAEGRAYIQALEGCTLDDALSGVLPPDDAYAIINGEIIPRSRWREVRLRAGNIVQARVVLHGGRGSNPIAAVLSLAVLIAAPFAAAGLLGFGANPAFAALAAPVKFGLLAAGIGTVGLLVVNTLLPPRLPSQGDREDAPRQYSLAAGSNRVRQFGEMLLLVGSHRVFPDVVALPYSEFDGDGNQILNEIFDFGIGDLEIATERFGDTETTNYDSLQTQSQVDAITLVAGNVDTIEGGELDRDGIYEITRTTNDGVTKLAVDLVSQHFTINDDGDLVGQSNTFRVRYKLSTGTDWTTSTRVLVTPNGGAGRAPTRKTYEFDGLPSGAYDVEVTLNTSWPVSDAKRTGSAALVSVRGYQDNEASFDGRNAYAIRIKAKAQVYGRLDSFSADCDQKIPTWDGAAWTANTATSNPAWIARQMLLGWFNSQDLLIAGFGFTTDDYEEEHIKEWGAFCDANSLTCNYIFEGQFDAEAALRLVAQCGWATVSTATGKVGFVWENDDQPVTALFTPANIVAGTFSSLADNQELADEIIGTFVDSAGDYKPNTIRRTITGVTSPKRPITIPLDGITDGDQAAKEINRTASAQVKHVWNRTWEARGDGVLLARGDVVGLAHDLVGGSVGGRLLAINSARNEVSLSGEVAANGTLWVWDLNGNVHSTAYSATAYPTDEVSLTTALPAAPTGFPDEPPAYRFMAFSDEGAVRKARITGIEAAAGNNYRISARDELAGYYTDRVADLTHPILPVTRRSEITGMLISDAVYGNALYLHITVIGSGNYRGAVIEVDDEVVGVTRSLSETLKAAVGANQGDIVTVTATPGNEFGTFGGSFTTTHEVLSDTGATDGLGEESVYAVTASATLPTNQRPSNSWGFDQPGLVNGLQWHDAPPDITAANPYLWRGARRVQGIPPIGAAVAAEWKNPTIFGRFGADGQQGIQGVEGADAEDGNGVEYVFTVTSSATLSSSRRPSNSWGYDQPGTNGGQQWDDGAPNVTESNPILWRSKRRVPGDPPAGTAVSDSWSEPRIVGRYGADGQRGVQGVEGADAEDGNGVEYVFTVTSSATLSSSRRPSNSWGYDQPGTNGGQQWDDGAPNVTESNPILWRSKRRVPGDPPAGTAVSDSWSEPRIVGRYGADGQRGVQGVEGADAEDGNGVEYVFTVTSSATLSSSRRPSNSWGFDEPGTRGGQTWDDGAPNTSASTPNLWRSQRRVEGIPDSGDSVSDSWSIPVIVGRYGDDGDTGMDGVDAVVAEISEVNHWWENFNGTTWAPTSTTATLTVNFIRAGSVIASRSFSCDFFPGPPPDINQTINPDSSSGERTTRTRDASDLDRYIVTVTHAASGATARMVFRAVVYLADGSVATKPGPPTAFSALGGSGSFTLEWDEPADDGSSPITDYDHRYRLVGVSAWSSSGAPTGADARTVTTTRPAGTYEVQVAAENALGYTYTNSLTVTVT